jgi:acetyltransferase EpsM
MPNDVIPLSGEINLFIIGAGWQGSEIQSYLADLPQAETVRLWGYVDEQKSGDWNGVEILGGFDRLAELIAENAGTQFHYLTATGNNRVREMFVRRIEALAISNLQPWTLRHPRSAAGQRVEIGAGCCLAPGSIITTNAKIGRHCILNIKASVSHDCALGDYVNLNPGATIAGNVRIGDGAYIGAGATVIDKVSLGAGCIIGAGAVVTGDIPPHVTAVGVPARVIKQH